MKTRATVGLALLTSALLLPALRAQAGIFFHSDAGQVASYGYGNAGWESGYYDPAWGMPMAVLVPPTARWQTDYSWGVGGTRISRVGAQFQGEYPGPMSAYNRRSYLPAPPQPSDTQQMGDYYVRGPRH